MDKDKLGRLASVKFSSARCCVLFDWQVRMARNKRKENREKKIEKRNRRSNGIGDLVGQLDSRMNIRLI